MALTISPASEVVSTCLGDGTIDELRDAQSAKGTGNDTEMANRDVGTFDEIGKSGHIGRYF